MNEPLPIDRYDLGFVLIAAVRYAIGRRTAAPAIVQRAVVAALPLLVRSDRRVLAHDIGEAFARAEAGNAVDEVDARGWQRVLDALDALDEQETAA
jgi:hypothetical protein